MNRFIKQQQCVTRPSLTFILTLTLSLFIASTASATLVGLADVPMDVQEGVSPNILLTVDDSGSMSWSFIPDSVYSSYDQARGASSDYNAMYYNPKVRYVPGVDENGASLGNASFTAAWDNGYNQSSTCTVNLSSNYKPSWYYGDNCDSTTDTTEFASNEPSGANGAAYYYVYDSSNQSGCTTSNNACYDAKIITSGNTFKGGPNRTDCADSSACTYDEEKQNFANWYSYYRKRTLLAKNAAGRAFAQITGNIRAAHQTINNDKTISLFNTFTGTPRKDFFDWLYAIPETYQGTPLRKALANGGEEFTKSGKDSPYAKEPGVTDTPEYTCRQNFQVLLTDGYWNGSDPTTPSISNFDNNTHSLPETTFGVSSYTATTPYKDTNSKYLADYAMYYWATDLRSTLTNNVPTYIKDGSSDYNKDGKVNNDDFFWNPVNDPATWQHMVSFTIGLGIDGTLPFNDTTYGELIDGTKSWGSDHVDDLWHAAINSRGEYFSAKNPTELVSAFSDVLNKIEARTGSSSAPAPSAPNYQSGTKIYQPVYNSSDWSGDLRRFDVTDLSTVEWNARDILNTQNYSTSRHIITYDPAAGKGIPFLYSSLNASQQTQLKNADVVNYIRGDRSNEKSKGGSFRNRSYVLGDIVDSAPVFVGPPNRLFPDALEDTSKPYTGFATTYKDREPIVWVGANDGMLHGFDADTGKEELGFVPTKVFDNLPSLTSTTYSHKFFVDGSPTERDVFMNGNWHTVLVGGLNRGGQEIYALDVTNPAKFTEGNASSLVLWEFTDANDPDLGYTYSAPQIAKTNDTTSSGSGTGKWMAFFGNGYNNTENDDTNGYCTDSDSSTPCPVSSTGNAVLYIVDVKDGSIIKKLDTGIGMDQDPTGQHRPNGLSTVALVDADGNYTVDYVYAGDLFGNLWKFDVTDSNPANWTIAKSGVTPTPLFIATDPDGNVQPITTAPVVGPHATQLGFMINFGTGKYLGLGDLVDTSVQTFYGIWDREEATTSITKIERKYTQAQSILETVTNQFTDFSARISSSTQVNWYTGSGLPTDNTTFLGWHMDLVDESGTHAGERVISDPQRRQNRVIFVTNIPSSDPCMAGGSSWIMELNASTGQRLNVTPFDYNNDGYINDDDLVNSTVDINGDGKIDNSDLLAAGSGIQDKNGGKLSRPTILLDANNNEIKLSSTSNATISKVKERGPADKVGRRSWNQLLP